MIKITNGQMTLTVPNSAYQTLYKASGFRPVDFTESSKPPIDSYPSTDKTAAGEEIIDEQEEDLGESYVDEAETTEETVDLSEIPLSEMDFYQLCDYADQLGLDHKGIRSKKELRALIRNNI